MCSPYQAFALKIAPRLLLHARTWFLGSAGPAGFPDLNDPGSDTLDKDHHVASYLPQRTKPTRTRHERENETAGTRRDARKCQKTSENPWRRSFRLIILLIRVNKKYSCHAGFIIHVYIVARVVNSR